MTTIAARPAKVTWRVTAGQSASVALSFVTGAGAPIDLTGRAFTAGAAISGGAVSTVDIAVDASAAASGELVLSIDMADTATVTGRLFWWLFQTVGGVVSPLLDGPLEVAPIGQAGINGTGASALTVQVVSSVVTVAMPTAPVVFALDATGVPNDYVLTAQGDGTFNWEPVTLLP